MSEKQTITRKKIIKSDLSPKNPNHPRTPEKIQEQHYPQYSPHQQHYQGGYPMPAPYPMFPQPMGIQEIVTRNPIREEVKEDPSDIQNYPKGMKKACRDYLSSKTSKIHTKELLGENIWSLYTSKNKSVENFDKSIELQKNSLHQYLDKILLGVTQAINSAKEKIDKKLGNVVKEYKEEISLFVKDFDECSTALEKILMQERDKLVSHVTINLKDQYTEKSLREEVRLLDAELQESDVVRCAARVWEVRQLYELPSNAKRVAKYHQQSENMVDAERVNDSKTLQKINDLVNNIKNIDVESWINDVRNQEPRKAPGEFEEPQQIVEEVVETNLVPIGPPGPGPGMMGNYGPMPSQPLPNMSNRANMPPYGYPGYSQFGPYPPQPQYYPQYFQQNNQRHQQPNQGYNYNQPMQQPNQGYANNPQTNPGYTPTIQSNQGYPQAYVPVQSYPPNFPMPQRPYDPYSSPSSLNRYKKTKSNQLDTQSNNNNRIYKPATEGIMGNGKEKIISQKIEPMH